MCGFVVDLFSGALLGQHALLSVLAFVAARVLSQHVSMIGALPQIVFAAGLTALHAIGVVGLTTFFTPGADLALLRPGVVLPRVAVNALVAPAVNAVVSALVAWAAGEDDRAPPAAHRHAELGAVIGLDQRVGGGSETDIQQRVPWIAAFIVLVFLLFAGRLFQLQVIQTDDLRLRSLHNSVRTLRLEAPRGDIVDRDGRILATTRPAFGVQLIPHDVRRPEIVIPALAQLIDREPGELRAQIGTPRGRLRFQPVRLADDLSYDQLARVESHLYALSGVVTDVRPRRHYLGGELAAHVLGYIGEIQSGQLDKSAFADYQQGEVIGQAGIEAIQQEALRGRAGGVNQIVDVAGRVVGVLDEIDPVPGGSVQLTIDLDLQQAAEAAFIPETPDDHARIGAVVALDVHSGDVLAMVSKPSFDPNAFAGGIDGATWKHLTTDKWKPIQNRAISGQYPPGSTYKAIVAAAGLQEGLVDPKRRVLLPGVLPLRQPHLSLLEARGPRLGRPAPRARRVVRRVLLHDRPRSRHRPPRRVRARVQPRRRRPASGSRTRCRA